jgi:hypothetical protein
MPGRLRDKRNRVIELTSSERALTVFHRTATVALLLAGLAVLAGCAGTAKGRDQSLYRQSASVTPIASDSDTALVVIRYPAMIHADAETLYVSSFAVNAIGGEVPFAQYGKRQTARLSQSLIAKSSYYAMSLYRELRDSLPEHTVLLSPHIIEWSEERQLHSRPILATEQAPSVLTVDFNIYTFPDVNEMMESPPLTLGDLVTPLFTVKSNAWGRPALEGMMISSQPLVSAAYRQAQKRAAAELAARYEGQPVMGQSSLDFIAFLAERSASSLPLPLKPVGDTASSRSAIESYPVEKIQMDGQLMVNLEETYRNDPFARNFVNGAAQRVRQALNEIDHGRATFFDRQAALARFDEELARVFFIRSVDERIQARLRLAEALLRAEREFLFAQSETVYQGTYEGDFGLKMRKIIEAEYRMLEERRRLARVQNVTAAVAALAMAGTVYGATVTTTASTAMVTGLTGLSLVGSVWAMNRSLDARTESEEISEAFVSRMAPAFERQMSVQVEWLESREIITAQGFAEFRNKTLSLYQSRIRSIGVPVRDECTFRSAELDATGRWYGQCRDGLAGGEGYGLAITTEGASVEYLGQAADGQPEGIGAMLIRKPEVVGGRYLEGRFHGGVPDGLVRLIQVDAPARVREFKAGNDVGRGNEGRWKGLAFAPAQRGLLP